VVCGVCRPKSSDSEVRDLPKTGIGESSTCGGPTSRIFGQVILLLRELKLSLRHPRSLLVKGLYLFPQLP